MKRTPIRKVSSEQSRINAALNKRKKWLLENEPYCIFCYRSVGAGAELAHKVRRSWASSLYTRFELQTMPKNTGLGHHNCHDIFDNDKEGAKLLPRYNQILEDIKEIEPQYYEITFN